METWGRDACERLGPVCLAFARGGAGDVRHSGCGGREVRSMPCRLRREEIAAIGAPAEHGEESTVLAARPGVTESRIATTVAGRGGRGGRAGAAAVAGRTARGRDRGVGVGCGKTTSGSAV